MIPMGLDGGLGTYQQTPSSAPALHWTLQFRVFNPSCCKGKDRMESFKDSLLFVWMYAAGEIVSVNAKASKRQTFRPKLSPEAVTSSIDDFHNSVHNSSNM